MDRQIAFNFLNKLKESFLKAFSHDSIYDAIAYQLNSFDKKIKKLINEFSNKIPKASKLLPIDEANILFETLNTNISKTNIICEKANNLTETSMQYVREV